MTDNEEVESYFIDGNDFTHDNDSCMLYSAEGIVGINVEIDGTLRGKSIFEDGSYRQWIYHYFNDISSTRDYCISITSKGDYSIWVVTEEQNRFKVGRNEPQGELEFFWEISLIQ